MNKKVNEQLAVEIGKRLLEPREDAKISLPYFPRKSA